MLWYYDQLVFFNKQINANVYSQSLFNSILLFTLYKIFTLYIVR